MNTTVFLFHPRFGASHVNAALAASAEAAGVRVRYLYDLYPHGRIDVAAEQAVLEEAERIVLQFPMYWYSTPALLKQWQDDVLTWGWAYGSKGTALHGKELLVAVSSGGGAESYSRDCEQRYTMAELLRPLQATSNLIGTTFLRPFVTFGALGMADDVLAARAAEYAAALSTPREAFGTHEV